jgi:L,D-peptidoglycan transpeptidase YkuD (ErfK/YbiS/YcfS/YnhG family)
MIFTAYADGRFDLNGRIVRCAIGPAGVVDASAKHEGDGKSPIGVWPMRRVLYRADRRPAPITGLSATPLAPDDGWSENPADPNYNRQIKLAPGQPGDRLWREDHLYDVIVILGHNDDPVVPGAGSAIFLHLARPGYSPTQGCVALSAGDLDEVLALANPGDAVSIREA